MINRKLFVAVAAVAALGAAAGAAVAQTASQKALVDQAKAAGTVGEQADGFLGVRTSVNADTQAAVSATNAGRSPSTVKRAASASIRSWPDGLNAEGRCVLRSAASRRSSQPWPMANPTLSSSPGLVPGRARCCCARPGR